MSSYKGSFEVVTVKQDPQAYRKLVNDWWNWVFEPNCDAKSDRGDVTFMRDEIIGGPKKTASNVQMIKRKVGTNVFFPIYHVHICDKDPYPKGGQCDTPQKRDEAARNDLDQLNNRWANISKNYGKLEPITTNFAAHEVEPSEFEIEVGENDLKREPKYHLEPGRYKGVTRGTYMLLRNFKEGEYVFDFGGEANNFHTESVYIMKVK